MPLISCEVSLTLTWSENCVLTDITTKEATAAQGDNLARPAIIAPANATFKITDTKLYMRVVTLSTEGDNYFLEQLKSGFKRTIKWNKYNQKWLIRLKLTTYYLFDPTFNKVNRLFVLSFENEKDRISFSNITHQKLK